MSDVKAKPLGFFGQLIENFSLAEFTPQEASFVVKGRLCHMFSSLNFNISAAAALAAYMRHSGGSSTTMAVHAGAVRSATNLCNLFISPAVGCLSDTIGRKPLMIGGRLGWALWWVLLANIDRFSAYSGVGPMRLRFIGEILCWGIIQAGTWSVFTASQADLFGTRPTLMAKVSTTGGFCWDIGDSCGSLASGLLASRAPTFSIYLSAVCAMASIGIISTMPETLPKEKRRPFKLTEANPIGSLGMLVNNGVGVTRLATMTGLLFSTYDTWTTRNAYRMGELGLSASSISYISIYNAICMMFSQNSIVLPLHQKSGFTTAMHVGCIGGAIAFMFEGLSWAGTPRVRLLLCLAGVSFHGLLTEICGHSFRPMITKQGIEYSKKQQKKAVDAGLPAPGTMGLGALSAAVSNLSSLLGIAFPLVWSGLYSFFGAGRGRKLLGAGGHWFIAGAFLLTASAVLRTSNPKDMYLNIADEVHESPKKKKTA